MSLSRIRILKVSPEIGFFRVGNLIREAGTIRFSSKSRSNDQIGWPWRTVFGIETARYIWIKRRGGIDGVSA